MEPEGIYSISDFSEVHKGCGRLSEIVWGRLGGLCKEAQAYGYLVPVWPSWLGVPGDGQPWSSSHHLLSFWCSQMDQSKELSCDSSPYWGGTTDLCNHLFLWSTWTLGCGSSPVFPGFSLALRLSASPSQADSQDHGRALASLPCAQSQGTFSGSVEKPQLVKPTTLYSLTKT